MRQQGFQVMFVGIAVAAAMVATAQQSAQRPPGGPEPDLSLPLPTAPAAPDWLVWRVFHDSLLFYRQQSPDVVRELLKKRADIGEDMEMEQFLKMGQSYLGELVRIEEEARDSVRMRYQSGLTPPMPSSELLSRTSRGVNAAVPPTRLVSGRTQDGRKLYDALVADGFVAQVESERQATLQAHLQQLSRAFGSVRLERLTDWIRADVAPHVMVGGPLREASNVQPPTAR